MPVKRQPLHYVQFSTSKCQINQITSFFQPQFKLSNLSRDVILAHFPFQVHLVKAFTLASRCCWVDHHSDVALRIQQLTSHLRWPNGTKVMISWPQDISWYIMIILLWHDHESKLKTSWDTDSYHQLDSSRKNLFDLSHTFCSKAKPFQNQNIKASNTRPCLERRERERSNPLIFFPNGSASQFLCVNLPGSRAQGRKMMSP